MGLAEIAGIALMAWGVGVLIGHAAGYGRGKSVGAAQARAMSQAERTVKTSPRSRG